MSGIETIPERLLGGSCVTSLSRIAAARIIELEKHLAFQTYRADTYRALPQVINNMGERWPGHKEDNPHFGVNKRVFGFMSHTCEDILKDADERLVKHTEDQELYDPTVESIG